MDDAEVSKFFFWVPFKNNIDQWIGLKFKCWEDMVERLYVFDRLRHQFGWFPRTSLHILLRKLLERSEKTFFPRSPAEYNNGWPQIKNKKKSWPQKNGDIIDFVFLMWYVLYKISFNLKSIYLIKKLKNP